jgi:RNA 3'-phosphate cyclase
LLDIDGSQKSGSGTILRLSVALAAIKGEPLHIYNIRQNRPQPGLKPQHLEAVLTAAKLCSAELEGATLGNREIWFKPKEIKGGNFEAEIGTAGSIPMLFMTVLPICLRARNAVRLHVTKGGTDTIHAPTINYLRNVLLTALKRMGVDIEITVQRYGYYPKGMGEATLTLKPPNALKPLRLETFGQLKGISGVSVCTGLADRRVAERQAKAASDYLSQKGYAANIEIMNDSSNPMQKGSSIALWAETDTDAIVGADAIGELKKTSEAVGTEAAEKLFRELSASPTVDVHLADMLIPYVALAEGKSAYLARKITDHLEANIWLAEKILNTKFNITKIDNLIRIEKGD